MATQVLVQMMPPNVMNSSTVTAASTGTTTASAGTAAPPPELNEVRKRFYSHSRIVCLFPDVAGYIGIFAK